jgi:arginase
MDGKQIRLIGVPLDLGADRRGVDMGPSVLRLSGLGTQLKNLGYQVEDTGNIATPVFENCSPGDLKCKYEKEIASVSEALAARVFTALEENTLPLVMGGDHSIAIGTLAGVARYFRQRKQNIGLLWIDAHGDINTPETTLSGNVHGMPVAHLLGKGRSSLNSLSGFVPAIDASKTVLVGVRDLDPGERKMIRDLGVKVFTMRDIDERGIKSVMSEALDIIQKDTAGFHVSFDLDGMDPAVAPGVGTAVPGGLTFREGHLAMELVADTQKMLSYEIVELNPILDNSSISAKAAVAMTLSAFGTRTL